MKSLLHLIFLFFLLEVQAQQPTQAQIKQVAEAKKEVRGMKGQTFPDFKLTTLAGEEISKQSTRGKIVLFNFWFTRCRPCIQEMPELNEMVKKFEREDIIFIAPTFDDSTQVNRFLDRFDFEYEVVAGVKDFCLDLNIRSYPTHFVLNRDGIIEKVRIGYSVTTVQSLRKSLRKLL